MPSPYEVKQIAEMPLSGQRTVLKALSDVDLVSLRIVAIGLKTQRELFVDSPLVEAYCDLIEMAEAEHRRRTVEYVEKTWACVFGEQEWVEPFRTGYAQAPTDWFKLISEAKKASDEALAVRTGAE